MKRIELAREAVWTVERACSSRLLPHGRVSPALTTRFDLHDGSECVERTKDTLSATRRSQEGSITVAVAASSGMVTNARAQRSEFSTGSFD
jgi:hypothetical protein